MASCLTFFSQYNLRIIAKAPIKTVAKSFTLAINSVKGWEATMQNKGAQASKHWWQTNPELGLAAGWAIISGALWVSAYLTGVI